MTRLPIILLLTIALAVAAPAQQPAGGAARTPQAKSQAEFKDYNAAYAITGGEAMEKAAEDFAAKYRTSELRVYLYSKAMNEYEKENRAEKILAMGEKVLALDAKNPVALAMTATVLSDALKDSDQDREQKIATIKQRAAAALEAVDAGLVQASASPEQVDAYKNMLRSTAHSALGITALKSGDDAGAEKELKTSAELTKAAPDGFVLYHLALAQDHQQKYAEALATVQDALKALRPEEEINKLAQGERDRLLLLLKRSEQPK